MLHHSPTRSSERAIGQGMSPKLLCRICRKPPVTTIMIVTGLPESIAGRMAQGSHAILGGHGDGAVEPAPRREAAPVCGGAP